MYSIMLDKVSKSYQTNNYVVKAVNQADFAADKGTSVAIIGPSGSGKSTLLNMMGLIIYPDFGRILINGEDVTNLPDTALCHFRNSYFGYVVQDFALIERESVFNNIRIPLLYNKKIKRGEHKERIHRAAESLLIQDKLHRKVEQLSGGERQMVAMARALMMKPSVLLLDEPSAGLSPMLQDETFIRVRQVNKAGVSVVIVEQNARRCLQICDRGYVLDQGRNAYSGKGRDLMNDPKVVSLYLGNLEEEVQEEGR